MAPFYSFPISTHDDSCRKAELEKTNLDEGANWAHHCLLILWLSATCAKISVQSNFSENICVYFGLRVGNIQYISSRKVVGL